MASPEGEKVAQSEPFFEAPKRKWYQFGGYRWHKALYYANLVRGRYITALIGTTLAYIVGYNTIVYFWKGPDHPRNIYRWNKMKERGELSPELLEKERLCFKFDEQKANEFFEQKWPNNDNVPRLAGKAMF